MTRENKINILVVDDSITIRRTIIKHLDGEYVTHEAENGEEAWKLIESNKSISLIFADMHMPVMNGMLLLKKIRSSECERIASLPVIIVTGYENTEAAKRASHNIGATDFICKPFDSFDILNKVGSYTKLDKKLPKTKQKATHDALTGLLNESSFLEHGECALDYANRGSIDTSLLCMQIIGLGDVFKEHGVATTKQIIAVIASHLNEALNDIEKIVHMGSGKFTIVLPATNEFKANIVAIRLQKLIHKLEFEKDDAVIHARMAVGISFKDKNEKQLTLDDLRLQAGQALEMSLEQPGAPVVRYDETYEKQCIESEYAKEIELEKLAKQDHRLDDVSEMSKCFASIMSRDFDKIPAASMEAMIEPLQDFLEYAYTSTEVKIKKPVGAGRSKG
jgi:diguanylate cyclase (GGDEF)-like protein